MCLNPKATAIVNGRRFKSRFAIDSGGESTSFAYRTLPEHAAPFAEGKWSLAAFEIHGGDLVYRATFRTGDYVEGTTFGSVIGGVLANVVPR